MYNFHLQLKHVNVVQYYRILSKPILDIFKKKLSRLPLLTPFGSRRTEHSSMAPNGSNISLMSGSEIFFDSMPMKSFLSVTHKTFFFKY